jgi:hypothetical protein
MFPSMRQRLMVAGALVLAMLAWGVVVPMLRPGDGSGGITLADASGGAAAWAAVLAAAAVAAGLGLLTSLTGNPLGGPFVFGGAATLLAALGGPMDGWMRRAALPSGYLGLVVELMVWGVMLIGVGWLLDVVRPRLLPGVPRKVMSDHLGDDLRFGVPGQPAILAGLVSALVGGVLGFVLLRSTDSGQVTGSLIVAFAIGAFTAQMMFPANVGVLPMLLSPLMVGAGAYLWVYTRYANPDAVLSALYNLDGMHGGQPRLLGLAVALPVHYLCAVAGVTLGVGLALTFEKARHPQTHADGGNDGEQATKVGAGSQG